MSFVDKLRTQKLLSFTLILFTLSVGIVIGTLINSGVKAAKDDRVIAPGATPLTIPNPVELSNQFTQIAKQVEPSVVHIATSYGLKQNTRAVNPRGRRQVAPPEDDDQGGMEDFFQRFFGGGNPFGGNGGPEAQPRGSALGSGVVVDRAGYILTNNHVVDKADRIQVKFPGDSAEYEAKVIGTDPDTDLAVIRVEGKASLAPAKIGNSDAVQVGDWAVAIGSPFGFQATVTAGIISAKERDVPDSSQFQHFLQTDCAINPGNSGGPLLNIRGEVIGINTAIATRTGGYQGIGFALPINTAANVYNQIIKNGKVTRGSIGITFSNNAENTRNLPKAYGHGATEGVFVASVQPGGPSEKAGLKEADIITAVNGKPVRDGNELVNIVSNSPVGTPLSLNVLRDGKRESFHVTVGDLSQVFPERYGRNSDNGGVRPEGATSVSFGVSIQTLTPQMRDGMGLKQSGGVLISDVDRGSFADDVGLEPNDVITSLNQQPVNSVEDVKKLQANLKPGDAVAFRVLRRAGGAPQFRGNRNNSGGEWSPLYLAGTLPHHMQ
jgi:serine protease Do